MRNHITETEINELYKEFNTPENVKRHCRAVTNVALTIAEALDDHGVKMDLALVQGAGLSHDAARTMARHWDVMADKLAELGYPEESIIVRNHMTGTGYHDISDVSEMDMIWLGDRLVLEDEYVGIDERFRYIIEKAVKMGASEENIRQIENSKQKMQHLMDQIAEVIGQSIDSLFVKNEEDANEELTNE